MKRSLAGLLASAALAAAVALAAPSPAAAGEDHVVARVNGIEIRQSDVDFAAGMYGGQLDSMPADARLSVLVDVLVEARLASDAAKAAGLDREDDVRRQLEFFEAQTLRSAFLERQLAARVTDAAVRKVYDEEVAQMPAFEFRASHILVATGTEAVAVIDALAAGADFAALAAERSLDRASGPKGGDLGVIVAGTSMAEIEAAAAVLDPGEFTRTPVASPFGFHVVRLEERRSRPIPSFGQMAGRIREALEAQAAGRITAELRAAAIVEKLVPDAGPGADDDHEH